MLIAVIVIETSELIMVIWHPALSPAFVAFPRTITIAVAETMLHDVAEVPDDGLLPTFAEQVKLVVNPDPDSVIILLAYAAAGLTAVAAGGALMVKD